MSTWLVPKCGVLRTQKGFDSIGLRDYWKQFRSERSMGRERNAEARGQTWSEGSLSTVYLPFYENPKLHNFNYSCGLVSSASAYCKYKISITFGSPFSLNKFSHSINIALQIQPFRELIDRP